MKIELTAGVWTDITTAIGAGDTATIGAEYFSGDGNVGLSMRASQPTDSGDFDAILLSDVNSPLCFRSVKGVAGSKLYAMLPVVNPQRKAVIIFTKDS